MGNGIFTCKTCNEICPGKTRIEINNNVYANNSEIKLDDKSKSEQRIITNSFNPNYKCEFSGDSNINQNENYHNIKNNTNMNNKKENTFDNSIIEEEEPQIIITENVNDGKNEKMIGNSPSNSLTGSNYNLSNSKNIFHNYNIEMINYLNKLRKTPKLVIKDIEHIIKHNVKKTDDKEFIITDNTNEIIKLSFNFETIKEILIKQEPANILKLNNKLKIYNYLQDTQITEKTINELIINKKKELIKEYPKCFFYPIFIKNIKINYIFLLENSKIRDKIFNKNFLYFYASTFNGKSNRFFAILCFA